jgi:large subunit ribosomal protein L5
MSSLVLSKEQYREQTKDLFAGKNLFAQSKISSVSVNVGLGSKYDTKQKQAIYDLLVSLFNQKPRKSLAKRSVSNFGIRQGDWIGVNLTLRGLKAYDFLMHLVYLALPRTRDFKGLKREAFDKNYKTYSIGVPAASIFPTIGFGSNSDFGMQINIKFSESTPDNIKILESLNFPLKAA